MQLRQDRLSLDVNCNKHRSCSVEYEMFIAANKQVMRLSELWNNSQPVVYARFTSLEQK